jgi:hypothetical protein
LFRRNCEEFVVRQQRRVSRTHVSENHTARFKARISEMADFIPLSPSARLTRLLQNLAANIVKPPVIKTSKPAIFDPAIAEIRAAMGTMKSQ